jgi:glycosyltransferase involved in cell wall biosynthesis
MKTRNNLVIAIYSLPDYYPPSLNAIEYLSRQYESVAIVHRNISGSNWVYPANVRLISPKNTYPVRVVEKAFLLKKIAWFLKFTLSFFTIIRQTRANTVLIYDALPVLSYRLFYRFIKKPEILWYHNHDVTDPQYIRKWSLTWLAWKSEKWLFPKLDIFSLPALERKVWFPTEKLRGKFFFLPNFPSITIFNRFKIEHKDISGNIRILYQGSIGPLHGIEEVLGILERKIAGKNLELCLKGFISETYKNELESLANQYGVKERLTFMPPTSYSKVIENAQTCHIGLGIHKKQDIMNKTLGTSSNKIYEYAASGLPVILYDNLHFRGHLEQYKWAFFTDCSETSLVEIIEKILLDYTCLSYYARENFSNKLNFEKYFEPVADYLHFIQLKG